MKRSLLIGLSLLQAYTALEICEMYVPGTPTGAGTANEIMSSSEKKIQLNTIQAFFYTHNSYPNALVGLLFKSTYAWGDACPGCSWVLAGNNIGAAVDAPEVTIPASRTLISWEQSLSSDRTTLMGITLTLDDASTLTLGTIGPEKEDVQYLGGPIHGIKWTYNDVITSITLGFNSCYCAFE